MKINSLIFTLLFSCFSAAFGQTMPVVGVLPFEAAQGVAAADAAAVTQQIVAELSSWGTMNVVQNEAGAEYIVRGSLSRQGGAFVLWAVTIEVKTEKRITETREQAASVGAIPVFAFCTKTVENVPLPNFLLGKWQSVINMPDGPVSCIIEFRSDRTVRAERYDNWEHRQNNALRYEGYGSGSYSYAGYSRRNITVNSQQVQTDAAVNISLKLEDVLTEQTSINQSGLRLLFSGDKNSFEIVSGSLPCGQNYDGPSVYPSVNIGFTQFSKIR